METVGEPCRLPESFDDAPLLRQAQMMEDCAIANGIRATTLELRHRALIEWIQRGQDAGR